jgi:hypothetical protein
MQASSPSGKFLHEGWERTAIGAIIDEASLWVFINEL